LTKKKFFSSQTGSGKTYTMGTGLDGSNIPPEHQGKKKYALSIALFK
jgi:hypothetical protein